MPDIMIIDIYKIIRCLPFRLKPEKAPSHDYDRGFGAFLIEKLCYMK